MNSNEYIIRNQPMICASAEAEKRKYHMIKRDQETWLYTDGLDAASYIYYHNANDKNSHGFAGRTLTFSLVNGTEIKLKGPWHTSPNALYQKTGIDFRNKYMQQVVIANAKELQDFPGKYGTIKLSVLKGIFHIDEEPVIGAFNRGNKLAKDIANSIGRSVWCYIQTVGGSCLSLKKSNLELSDE